MMDTIVIARPRTAPPIVTVTEPPQAYIPNHGSANHARPEHNMPPQPEYRYQRLQRGQSAFGENDEGSAKSETTLTASSSENQEQIQGDPRGRLAVPSWTRLVNDLLPNPFSPSITEKAQNTAQDRGYDKIKYDKLEDFEEGIPRLSTFLDSNESFRIFQRFGPYAARILLHRQIELNQLCEQLRQLDAKDAADPTKQYRLNSIEYYKGMDDTQRKLLQDIEIKIGVYYDLLLKYADIGALPRPPPHDQRSVLDWMTDNRPLMEGEDDFIYHIMDHVSATKGGETVGAAPGGHMSRLERIIETYTIKNPDYWLYNFLAVKGDHKRTSNPLVNPFDRTRLAKVAQIITVSLAVGFLMIPVFLLFLVSMSRAVMVVTVLAFVLVFSWMLTMISEARTQEVLIGTAAYGAFLVTFLGNMNQGFAPGSQ